MAAGEDCGKPTGGRWRAKATVLVGRRHLCRHLVDERADLLWQLQPVLGEELLQGERVLVDDLNRRAHTGARLRHILLQGTAADLHHLLQAFQLPAILHVKLTSTTSLHTQTLSFANLRLRQAMGPMKVKYLVAQHSHTYTQGGRAAYTLEVLEVVWLLTGTAALGKLCLNLVELLHDVVEVTRLVRVRLEARDLRKEGLPVCREPLHVAHDLLSWGGAVQQRLSFLQDTLLQRLQCPPCSLLLLLRAFKDMNTRSGRCLDGSSTSASTPRGISEVPDHRCRKSRGEGQHSQQGRPQSDALRAADDNRCLPAQHASTSIPDTLFTQHHSYIHHCKWQRIDDYSSCLCTAAVRVYLARHELSQAVQESSLLIHQALEIVGDNTNVHMLLTELAGPGLSEVKVSLTVIAGFAWVLLIFSVATVGRLTG